MPYAVDRIKTEPSTYTQETVQTNPYNLQQTSASYVYSSVKSRRTWTRTGTNTPGFHNPNRKSRLPNNPFYFKMEESVRLTGSYVELIRPIREQGIFGQKSTVTGCTGEEPGYGGGEVSASMIAAAQRKLNTKLLLKVKDQKANLALAFAERAKTKQLLGDTLIKLATAVARAKKGDLAGAARAMGVSPRARAGTSTSKHIATSWLELQYGWRPLISDMYGVVDAYRTHVDGREPIARVKAREALSASTSSVNTTSSASYDTYTMVEEKVELSAGCTFKQSAPSAIPKSLTELGITNPLMLAWELLPWSFVVDWFLPIGDYLDSMDATNGTTFDSGYNTIFKKTTVKTLRTYKSSGNYQRSGSLTGTRTIIEVSRSVLSQYPHNSFPSFKDPYSHEHFANAVALFITNFRK